MAAHVFFENFGGYGPTDLPGLEIATNRTLHAAVADPLAYGRDSKDYLADLDRANVAFVADQPFLWPAYWGINRHTAELSALIAREAPGQGWERVERLAYGKDASRFVDVYVRASAAPPR